MRTVEETCRGACSETSVLPLRTEPWELDSPSMAQGLGDSVSRMRAPRNVWAAPGPPRTEVRGRHRSFPALWTLRGITARSALIVALCREKGCWLTSLLPHPGPVLAPSLRWCRCELKERVTPKWGAIFYLSSYSSLFRKDFFCISMCVISTKLNFQNLWTDA